MLGLQNAEECERLRFAQRKKNIDYVWLGGQNAYH